MIVLVHPNSGWILSHIARRIYESNPIEFKLCPVGNILEYRITKVDGFYYIDVQNCWLHQFKYVFSNSIHLGMFTHLDKNDSASFREHWSTLDGIVHMAERYLKIFTDEKRFPPERQFLLRPGEVKHLPLQPIRIGIVQRGEHVGKGHDIVPHILNLLEPEILDVFEFHICGKGWQHLNELCDCVYYDEDDFESVYKYIDYLWIPSLWEGGPMAFLEAMASGIPVIASDVGFVKDFLKRSVLPDTYNMYKPGDAPQAAAMFQRLAKERLTRRAIVSDLSYDTYGQELLRIFEHLKDGEA